jgi:NAD(P)-dependent dehydrogenase (short-subunit alcohol dehydrogenase family)
MASTAQRQPGAGIREMSDFENRVAVITGGAAGIGRAMARAFARRGAHLVLADIDEPALSDAEAEFSERGTEVLTVPTDVRERDSVFALADATYRAFGRAHIVCNNAGICPVSSIVGIDPLDWQVTMGINFWGVVHGVDAFVPRTLEQGDGGHVVNTASMSGLTGMLGLGMYCASKFAVVGFTESLQRELRGQGIGVSVLCPMIVDTGIGVNSQRMLSMTLPDPEAVQDLLTGSVIHVDDVAARLFRAIERKDLYILTHPEQREVLRRRAARQDAMFEDDMWSL